MARLIAYGVAEVYIHINQNFVQPDPASFQATALNEPVIEWIAQSQRSV